MDYLPICNETGKPQGGHRFVLEQPGEKMLLVVGLNPSTADETHPDLTMHKVMGFAEGGGYDGFAMLNLSSERATDKWSLSATLDEPMHRKIWMSRPICCNVIRQRTYWSLSETIFRRNPT